MSKIKKYNNFSLIEVLCAIALIGIIFNMALMFYYDGRKVSRKYINKAAHMRSVSTLTKYWRNFVHANGTPVKVEANKILFKKQATVSVKKNQLIFATTEGQKTFTLPKAFAASFAEEINPQETSVLVLYLWTRGSKMQILKDKFIRVIASTSRGEQ
jgi:prepilin-type N-terminal cleavage/methylation domain-containing protein